jgi:SPP1 family predicted phage head-tail adaptor
MHAGKLRHLVSIESQTYTISDSGARIPSWSTQQSLWACILPLTGQDLAFARSFDATVSHQIVTRFTAGLQGPPDKFRITYANRVFHVKSVLNRDEAGGVPERNVWLLFLVAELTDQTDTPGSQYDVMGQATWDTLQE